MKKIYKLLSSFALIFFLNLGYAQTRFNQGYSIGYAEGYCYQKANCISPNEPNPPNPSISENDESYTDGYNRGFSDGRQNTQNSNDRKRYKTSKPNFGDTSSRNYSDLTISELRNTLKKKKQIESEVQEIFQTAYDAIRNYDDNGSEDERNLKLEYLGKIKSLADDSARILKNNKGDYQSLIDMLEKICYEFTDKIE